MIKYYLEVKNLTKHYPGAIGLSNVNFNLKPGEIKGLVGKNGAGKSTLVEIVAGLKEPSKGEIYFFGEKRTINNVRDSENLGFRFVTQEPLLMDDMSVAQNLVAREIPKEGLLLNPKKIYKRAEEIISKGGFDLDPKMKAGYLSVPDKQILLATREIFSRGAKIISLDEITCSLRGKDIDNLFGLIREQTRRINQSFIFITHELEEIFELCDSLCVLRDGRVIFDGKTEEITMADLGEYITGRKKKITTSMERKKYTGKVLEVKNINNERLTNVTFDLNKGETISIYGLRGSGKTELLNTIFGLMLVKKGEIILRGVEITNSAPQKMISDGIGYVPEDRWKSLFFNRSIIENITISTLKNLLGRWKLLLSDEKREKKTKNVMDTLSIDAPSLNAEVFTLSGGNKQKVMLGRSIAAGSNLYLMDEPTKGIDVGVKEEFYKMMKRLTNDGNSIIFTSLDMEEVIDNSDKILILYDGQIAKTVPAQKATKKILLKYSEGLHKN